MAENGRELGHLGIKVKGENDKRARWLAKGGRETTKRLHALLFDEERAAKAVAQLAQDNPGFTFTAEPLFRS